MSSWHERNSPWLWGYVSPFNHLRRRWCITVCDLDKNWQVERVGQMSTVVPIIHQLGLLQKPELLSFSLVISTSTPSGIGSMSVLEKFFVKLVLKLRYGSWKSFRIYLDLMVHEFVSCLYFFYIISCLIYYINFNIYFILSVSF